MPNQNILKLLQDQAVARRSQDSIVSNFVHDVEPGGVPSPDYRGLAMITYAYSIRTQDRYVGYSGTSGGMTTRNQELADHDMAWRRWERIQDVIGDGENHHGRSSYNCGEAAAFSIAVAYGEKLSDLVFASFGTANQIVDPCDNCKKWLGRSHGYYLHDGSFQGNA